VIPIVAIVGGGGEAKDVAVGAIIGALSARDARDGVGGGFSLALSTASSARAGAQRASRLRWGGCLRKSRYVSC
jgi:hypothetical protein